MNNKNRISLEQEIKSNSEDKNQEEEMKEELEEELESKVEKPKKKKKNKKLPKDGLLSLKRKRLFNEEFEEDQNLFKPEVRFDEKSQTKEKVWEFKNAYLPRDKINIQKSIILSILNVHWEQLHLMLIPIIYFKELNLVFVTCFLNNGMILNYS